MARGCKLVFILTERSFMGSDERRYLETLRSLKKKKKHAHSRTESQVLTRQEVVELVRVSGVQ